MELPREVIKWLQHLNLPYSFKNIKNASNGIIIAEIINTYMPQSINMSNLENGFSKDIKKNNWKFLKKHLESFNIFFDELSIINSDKNYIINLFIQLYEFFNGKKCQNEYYCTNVEGDHNAPSFSKPTITQKIRESAVHDIVDEDKRMMKTYQIVKDAEYSNAIEKEKKKRENQNKGEKQKNRTGSNETHLFNNLEKNCSIITINDISDYVGNTDIKTLDSFIKEKDNLKYLTAMNTFKGKNSNETKQAVTQNYEDKSVEEIIITVLSEYITDYEMEKENDNEYVEEHNKKIKDIRKYHKFKLYGDKTGDNLYLNFQSICFLKEYDLIKKILDTLKHFNENFSILLSLHPDKFFHIWKLFFPVISSSTCDNEIFILIMDYLKQLLNYLHIEDLTTKEILCHIILKSLFIIDGDDYKDSRCFCELIILIIKNDKHILMSILNMIKNNMSLNFFYLYLSNLLKLSENLVLHEKDIKDIYLYYIFIGLHANKEPIILYCLDMLNTFSMHETCYDILPFSSVLYNILEMKNISYYIFTFVVSANVVSKLMESDQNNSGYNAHINEFIKICYTILENTKRKELLYLFLVYSYKIINKNDDIYDIYFMKYSKLSDEELKHFIKNNIFEAYLRNVSSFKIIKKYFSNIFNNNINELNKKCNDTILNSLLIKGKLKEDHFLRILREYIIHYDNMETSKYLEIYNKIFENLIENLFSDQHTTFELSKDILNIFWLSSNSQLKVKYFEISASHLKSMLLSNKHSMHSHTKEYIQILEKDSNLKELMS
ncbi:conserved Plasmodium protein, unknown function [Plasmodium chabaudi adami]|uniref:CH-like domain-containing protein n=1 Tax=Plasmodium chabaudi adami TaxID=5826 RepID=A0A1D3LLP8_PLACE|nr:conserved Plasmodium protein, unknown function [Plasmodium chabaudi adami]